MKRLLFLAYYFPPLAEIGAQRPARLCRHLPTHGWEPTVLTVALRCCRPYDATLMKLLPPELDVHRAPCGSMWLHSYYTRHGFRSRWKRWLHTPVHAISRMLQRGYIPDDMLTWGRAALPAAERLHAARPFDAIITSMSPWSSGVIARQIAERLKLPYVIDLRDPWSYAPDAEEKFPPQRVAAERELERQILRDAAGVSVVTEQIEAHYVEKFGDAVRGKTAVVDNSFDPAEWTDVPIRRFDRFTVLHGGNIHGSRSLQPVMRALALLKKRVAIPEGKIQLVNYGAAGGEERAAASKLDLNGWVRFESPVSRHEFAPLLRGAHLLLVTERWSICVPGKTFDYLATGNPILAVVPRDGQVAKTIREAAAGYVVEESETELMADTILRAYEDWEAGRRTFEPNSPGRTAFSTQATSRILAQLLDRVVQQGLATPACASGDDPTRRTD